MAHGPWVQLLLPGREAKVLFLAGPWVIVGLFEGNTPALAP